MTNSDWMTSRKDRQADFPLDVQSRGRPLTEAEQAFAFALENIFADNCHDMDHVASALTEQQIKAPVSQTITWTVEILAQELAAINSDLDAAFEEHGYGA